MPDSETHRSIVGRSPGGVRKETYLEEEKMGTGIVLYSFSMFSYLLPASQYSSYPSRRAVSAPNLLFTNTNSSSPKIGEVPRRGEGVLQVDSGKMRVLLIFTDSLL